ncbi:recombinase family protein [Streptosporangium canum]|uniref:recombinase family protein n=1 Tax=Streptosporangium canum TaxID=324952 RepID=UPI0033AACE0D
MSRKRRAKVYVRVSAIMGRDDLMSPEIQIDACKHREAQGDVEIIGTVQDLDRSGRDFAGRKIDEMIEEVRRGEYDTILLWKWSRFGRNLRDSLNNLHRLKEAGGIAISATEPGNSETTMGRFSRNQMLSIAELQSDQISDSWKEAQAVRLKMGLPHNGHARFGYVNDGKGFKPDEELNGPALAEVYERWVVGEPLRAVAKDMADRGVRAPNGDILDNSRWIVIMDSGFAAGLIRKRKPGVKSKRFDSWDWFPGSHKALIPVELWESYKSKRLAGLGRNWADPKAKYSLSGLITCGRCRKYKCGATGTPYKVGQVMFRCQGLVTKHCKGVSSGLHLGEAAVLEWIEKKALNLHEAEEEAQKSASKRQENAEVKRLEKLADDIEKRLERLLDLYEYGEMSKERYAARKSDREAELRETLSALEKVRGSDRHDISSTFFTNLRDAWPALSHDRKRHMLKQVIKGIILHPAGHPGGRWEIIGY